MPVTAQTFTILIIVVLISISLKIYLYLTKHYNYWKVRGVPFKKPKFPFGSTKDLVLGRTFIGDGYDKMYKEFESERYFGIVEVQNPVLVLRDPDLVKDIMVRDFNHFSVRTYIGANPKEYILRHIINMNGEEWKEMRALLIPAFSAVKMKLAFSLMEHCSDRLVKHIVDGICGKVPYVEITDVLARFTMDIIASCAFGLETDCISDKNCKFFHTVGAMLKTSKGRFFRRFIVNFFPGLAKLFPLKLVPPEVTDMLTCAVRDSVVYREKYNLQRSDFLDILIQKRAKCCGNSGQANLTHENCSKGLTIEQITAQAFVFFIAGYTTDTSILSFCFFELARNKSIQNKLYQDIKNTMNKHGGTITYQALQEMIYMDQIVNETLRKYGSGQILIRTCTKQYKLSGSDVVLEPGTRVVIPTYSLHHDPKYFPDPYSFNPDRFSASNSKTIQPFAFLPFGEGPRNCIGRSFGLLQIKLGLASIISNFLIDLSPKQKVPLEIDKRCIVVTPAQPIFLKLTKRQNFE